MEDDPAASAAESDTAIDCLVLIGMWLTPLATIIFVKRLLDGWRFKFVVAWLVGFFVPFGFIAYDIFFPNHPPEGSYGTNTETCLGIGIFLFAATGLMNCLDSLVTRLLRRMNPKASDSSAYCTAKETEDETPLASTQEHV